MADGDVYEAAIGLSVDGESCFNVLHFRATGAVGAAELAASLRDNWCSAAIAISGSNTIYTGAKVVQKTHLGFPDAADLGFVVGPGIILNDVAIPSQLAACFSIKSVQYSRRGRGRFYMAGIGKTLQDKERLSAASLSGGIAAFIDQITNLYIAPNNTEPFKLGVFSRANFSLLSNPLDASFQDATSIGVHTVLSTMRSRKPRS